MRKEQTSKNEEQPQGMSQEEVAKELGIKRWLVMRLEKSALEKIRNRLKLYNINKEDLL